MLGHHGLCELCLHSAEFIHSSCPTCALPIAGPVALQCARCTLDRRALDSCTAVFEYGGQLGVALKRLKFAKRSDIAKTLSPLLLPRFYEAASQADLALAVPLHRQRLKTRGFNQAQRLLIPLARSAKVPVCRNGLHRIRNTDAQARLPAASRASNVDGAFRGTKSVCGQRVLLMDDISTTANTLRAAAAALRNAGATEIHGFVVARAQFAPAKG